MTESLCASPVAVVVLNWNRWRDTVACLTSVFALGHRQFRVIVCDNGSTNSSLAEIERWAGAATRRDARAVDERLLRWLRVDGADVELGAVDPVAFAAADLVLVANGDNLGFAAGNNIGVRAALRFSDAEFVWVLNNDTVVDSRALCELIKRMRATPGCGLCGSALVSHDAPGTLQAVAGRYSKWFARTSQLGFGVDASMTLDDDTMTRAADYVMGASMLFSRGFLEEVGLLAEDYFLYFEEIDIITRARGRFRFACATHSRVTHKWGASINPAESGRSSDVADYYFSRSRLLFTRRYYRYALPTVLLAVIGTALSRLARGRLRSARTVFAGLFDGLRGKRGARIVDGRPWPV